MGHLNFLGIWLPRICFSTELYSRIENCSLQNIEQLRDKSLREIVDQCPALTDLAIYYNQARGAWSKLTDVGLSYVVGKLGQQPGPLWVGEADDGGPGGGSASTRTTTGRPTV
jgi:hypothetical protein